MYPASQRSRLPLAAMMAFDALRRGEITIRLFGHYHGPA